MKKMKHAIASYTVRENGMGGFLVHAEGAVVRESDIRCRDFVEAMMTVHTCVTYDLAKAMDEAEGGDD